jgi:hypothetical protein
MDSTYFDAVASTLKKSGGGNSFIITISVSAGQTFTLPATGLSNTSIDWGDGYSSVYSANYPYRTYANAGIYTVKVTGQMTGFAFSNTGSKLALKTIENIGNTGLTTLYEFCYGCSNLVSVNDDGTFDTTNNATNGRDMFNGCANLTTVNVKFSKINFAYYAFFNCTSLVTLDVCEFPMLADSRFMFYNCSNLKTISKIKFDLTSSMGYTFTNCTKLESIPLGVFGAMYDDGLFANLTKLYNIPEATCNSITTANTLFLNCTSLVSVPKLTLYNAINCRQTFEGCTALKNVPSIVLKNLVDGSYGFFRGVTLNTTEYSNMLIRTVAAGPKTGSYLVAGNSKYNAAGQTARNTLINTYGWTITDGGLE